MVDVQKQFKNKLMSALGEALWIVGQKALFEAQSTVPVKTGTLKATGTISRIKGSNQYKWGCVIKFGGPEAPYAEAIEEGRAAMPYDNTPYTYSIKQHKRKAPGKIAVKAYARGGGTVKAHKRGGQTNIAAHTVTLKGQRRVPVTDGFITVSMMPEIKATHFLRNAVEKTMKTQLPGAIKNKLPNKMTLDI